MSESDKRKRVELILVMVLDVLALMISYGAANYIRNGIIFETVVLSGRTRG